MSRDGWLEQPFDEAESAYLQSVTNFFLELRGPA